MPQMPTEPCIRARRYGAGRPVLSWRWRLGPARFGRYRKPMGAWGCFRIYCRVRRLSHTETFEFVAFFWITPCIFLDNAFHFFEDVPVVLVSFVLWDSVRAPRAIL